MSDAQAGSMSGDTKPKPSPVKKPAGVSRRRVKGTGTWVAADANSALLAAMLKALKKNQGGVVMVESIIQRRLHDTVNSVACCLLSS
jgi:hypothetical protein